MAHKTQWHNELKTLRAKVIAILRRATGVLQWLLSVDHLPAPSTDASGASSRRGGFAMWLFAGDKLAEASCSPLEVVLHRSWLRWVLSPGHLPSTPDKPPVHTAGPRSFRAWLSSEEELRECNLECVLTPPHPTLSPREREEFSDALWAEKLPAPRVGFLRWLLSPDVCLQFAESPRRQSEGFWRSVLSSETCPCVEEPSRPRPKGFWHRVVSSERL